MVFRDMVNSPPNPTPHEMRTRLRLNARLDALSRAKAGNLAVCGHRARAAMLGFIRPSGLSHGLTGPHAKGDPPGPPCHLSVAVGRERSPHVEHAAAAAGVNTGL